nr:hypothetical protein [Tanacetum cinerariifolium]
NLFRDIQNKGLIPDVFTYTSMMQGLYETKNHIAATQLFNEMLAKDLHPNIFTYGILLNGMCNNSQVSDALLLFRKLEKDEMMKDACLYTILIDGFSKCGNLDMAIDLFDELLLKGLKPHMKTYTVVLRVLFREGLSGKAKELLQNMEENGCLPNSFTYNVIVRELLKKNECQEAKIYLEEMINRGFVPDYATFSMLLPLIPNEGQDSRLQNIIQKSVPKFTKLSDAFKVFDEMLHKKRPPSVIEFNKLIHNIVKMKHYTTALSLYKKISLVESEAARMLIDMEEKGVPPDTYTTLVNAFSKQGSVKDAELAVQAMDVKDGNFIMDIS